MLGALNSALLFALLYRMFVRPEAGHRLLAFLHQAPPGGWPPPGTDPDTALGPFASDTLVTVATLSGVAGAVVDGRGATAALIPPRPSAAYAVDLAVTALAPVFFVAFVLGRA